MKGGKGRGKGAEGRGRKGGLKMDGVKERRERESIVIEVRSKSDGLKRENEKRESGREEGEKLKGKGRWGGI